jgi:hypothetical protein
LTNGSFCSATRLIVFPHRRAPRRPAASKEFGLSCLGIVRLKSYPLRDRRDENILINARVFEEGAAFRPRFTNSSVGFSLETAPNVLNMVEKCVMNIFGYI